MNPQSPRSPQDPYRPWPPAAARPAPANPGDGGLAPASPPGPVPPGTPAGGAARGTGSDARSLIWALIPLLTCGIGTPFSFLYAAVRRRTPALKRATVGYSVLWLIEIAVSATTSGTSVTPGWASTLIGVSGLVSTFGGLIHALVIRRSVFSAPGADPNELAVAAARHRQELRRQARELAQRDPSLAYELRIGRPDLPRQYDDGGLIDVNHAPPQVLATLPGMTPQTVQRIVALRQDRGGFISAEELSVLADLPPTLTSELAEYTIYLP